jgi:ribonuclease HII
LKSRCLRLESVLWQKGIHSVAGIDEVGRGPLAGPVFACAAIFEENYFLPEVKDSKQLSAKKRESLAIILQKSALGYGLGLASVEEIDRFNIRQATFIAMKRAISALKIEPGYILIDGEYLPNVKYPGRGIIRGDRKCFTISAASIIAKVARDTYMQKLDSQYPIYKFAQNKGYGTSEHIAVIISEGPSPYHRHTFLGKILNSAKT